MIQPLALPFFVLLGGLQGGLQDAPIPEVYTLRLPPGPSARAWAGVGAETEPADLSSELAALARAGTAVWEQPAAWELWSKRLGWLSQHALQAPEPGAPRDARAAAAHADLALLAAAQGRGPDAWMHFSALTDAPDQAARVAAHLIPGVPLSIEIGAGGVPLSVPDGVTLRPILPEYPTDDPARDIAWRSAEVFQFPVGDARLHLRLAVESTGVELDLELLSGPTVEVLGWLPAPDRFAIRFEYLDWIKVPDMHVPTRVRLIPGEAEPHVLYGRIAHSPPPWPTARVGHLSAGLASAGLWLVIEPEDPDHAWWQAAALALGNLLRIEAGTRPPGDPNQARPGTELSVPAPDAAGPGSRQAFARYLASAVAAHVLNPRSPAKSR